MNIGVTQIMCFPCMTGRCGHAARDHADDLGKVPAVTYCGGSALCEDCAIREAAFLPDPEPHRDR